MIKRRIITQPNKLIRIVKKTILAIIVGVGCLFGGLFLAIISPLLAILSLVYSPTNAISVKLKSFEDTFKEIQDPDLKEKWKKDHNDLFPDDFENN